VKNLRFVVQTVHDLPEIISIEYENCPWSLSPRDIRSVQVEQDGSRVLAHRKQVEVVHVTGLLHLLECRPFTLAQLASPELAFDLGVAADGVLASVCERLALAAQVHAGAAKLVLLGFEVDGVVGRGVVALVEHEVLLESAVLRPVHVPGRVVVLHTSCDRQVVPLQPQRTTVVGSAHLRTSPGAAYFGDIREDVRMGSQLTFSGC